MPSRPLQVLHAPGQGPGYHRDCSMRMTGGRAGAHRYGLDHKEGAGAARRAEVRGGQVCPRGALGPDPTGPVGGVWALPKETAWHLDTPELAPRSPGPANAAPGAPGLAAPAAPRGDLPRAASVAPSRPHGMVKEAASGEAWAAGRDAARPPRPGRCSGLLK